MAWISDLGFLTHSSWVTCLFGRGTIEHLHKGFGVRESTVSLHSPMKLNYVGFSGNSLGPWEGVQWSSGKIPRTANQKNAKPINLGGGSPNISNWVSFTTPSFTTVPSQATGVKENRGQGKQEWLALRKFPEVSPSDQNCINKTSHNKTSWGTKYVFTGFFWAGESPRRGEG